VHQHVGEQQLLARLKVRGHAAVYPAQGTFGLVEVTARVPHLRQVEPGAVAYSRGHIVGEQSFEELPRFVVHAELQVEAAHQQLRLIRMVRQAVPVVVGEQARQRVELFVLVVVEECIAVVQIADARDRQLLRVVTAGARAAREQHRTGGEQQRAHGGSLAQAPTPSP
jgi:hypothetical protein